MSTHATPSASPARSPQHPPHAAPASSLPAISSLLSHLSRSHHTPVGQPTLISLGPAPLQLSSSATSSSPPAFVTASDFLHSRSISGSVRSADAASRAEDESDASQASSDHQSQQSSAADSAVSDTSSQSSTLSLSSLASLRRLLDTETAAELAASHIIQPATTGNASTPSPASSSSSSKPPPVPSLPSSPHSHYRDIGNEAVWSVSSCKSGNGVAQLRDNQLDTFWQSDGHAPHVVSLVFGRKVRVCAVCFYVDYKVDESYTPLKVSVRGGSSIHAMHDVAVMELEEPTGWITVRTLVPQAKRHKLADDEADEDDKKRKKAAAEAGGLRPTSFFSASSPTGRLLASGTAAAADASATSASSSGLVYVPLRCHHLQLVIHSSHQQGKDTHVREVRVYGDATAGNSSTGGRNRVDNKEDRPTEQRSRGQKVALLHPVFTSIEFQSTACLR